MSYRFRLAVLGVATLLPLLSWTLSPATAQDKDKTLKEAPPSVTDGKVTVNGREIEYRATAGKLLLRNDAGDPQAEVFYVAYTRKGTTDLRTRPITFCFNGGPGSSSVWLHLGMVGPKRLRMPDDAATLKPPYRLDVNEFSLLDETDLVMIDPVSTGYSRPAKGVKKSEFHGYQEDLRSVAQFIHDYTTRNERWSSPKFVMGESYGGIRAAGLSGTLRERYRIELNGIILISAVVNFQTIRFGGSNDLPYVLFLPTFAATAWYHKALEDELQDLPVAEVVAEAERFAAGAYATALLQGTALATKQRDKVAKRFARLTGISADYVQRANLRVSMSRFGKELLRKDRRTVGRFDGRYKGVDRDHVGDRYSYDSSGAAIFGPFTATMNDYLRRELKVVDDRVYEILTGNVQPWSYRGYENRYVDATETLRQAMTANPHLRVFVACGYYDLATPHFAIEHTVNHLQLAPQHRDHVRLRYYQAGHMMYIHEPSLKQLKRDLQQFYADALK